MTDSTVAAHYERLLAEHYTWMLGDYDEAVAGQRALLSRLGVSRATVSGRALDLGAGSGVQSRALGELGYRVTAVDSSAALLSELETRAGGQPIVAVLGDVRDLNRLETVRAAKASGGFDVVVCMGDTITHLSSADEVVGLIADAYAVLAPAGLFVVTYRDLTPVLSGLDRFIPVRSDANRVMTCFLEFDDAHRDSVHVHDLVYVRDDERWTLRTSSYRKLRLATDWMMERLRDAGFEVAYSGPAGRLTGIVGRRVANVRSS